nr:hypothetical protein [Tanacetum cinerariifolium]
MNAGEFLEMDPYEEVSQQGQVHPLSSAYLSDPMKLDEHVPVHVLEPEHLEYHAPLYDDIQVEDDDEDPEEDPSKEHDPEDDDEDPEEDPNEEHEPEDSDEAEPFEEDETAVTPPPPRHRRARIFVRPQTPMAAFTKALIDSFVVGSYLFPLPPTSHSFAAATRAPRGRYDFVDTVEAGQGLIRSPGHDAWTIARAADRVEDVGYVRSLQASKHRMMTSIEEVNLRVSYQAQVHRRESKTAYETKLQEVHQTYLSSEAQNRALLARHKTLETHMSRMEWQHQSAEDHAVTKMMRIHTLEARARTDTVEDTGSCC